MGRAIRKAKRARLSRVCGGERGGQATLYEMTHEEIVKGGGKSELTASIYLGSNPTALSRDVLQQATNMY